MKIKLRQIAAVFLAVLIFTGLAWAGSADANDSLVLNANGGNAFIGLRLSPVPDLLNKHLQLQNGNSVLVNNILLGSPADTAGLERDDIIVAINGNEITGYNMFVDIIRQSSPGTAVTLTIIHNGQRRQSPVTLAAAPRSLAGWRWRYSMAPEAGPIMPRTFRMQPGTGHWQEVPLGNPNVEEMLSHLFEQHNLRPRHRNWALHSVEVIINGDPDDGSTPIIVHTDQGTYRTTIGEIDSLPEHLQEAVKDAIESSRYSSFQGGRFNFKIPGPVRPEPLELPATPGQVREINNGTADSGPAAMEARLEQLIRRIEELERNLEHRQNTPDTPYTDK